MDDLILFILCLILPVSVIADVFITLTLRISEVTDSGNPVASTNPAINRNGLCFLRGSRVTGHKW